MLTRTLSCFSIIRMDLKKIYSYSILIIIMLPMLNQERMLVSTRPGALFLVELVLF